MSFRRYIAANSRDAMAQVRRELGADAVILSSKRVGDGYEIVAAAPHAMERLVENAPATRVAPRAPVVIPKATPPVRTTPATIRPGESFQEFVRRQTQAAAQDSAATRAAARPNSTSGTAHAAPTPSTAAAARSAARYQEVAQAEAGAQDDEDIWKPTTFHVPPSAASGERIVRAVVHEAAQPLVPPRLAQRAPQPSASARLPTRRIAPEPDAPAAPIGAPAVFRRRSETLDTHGASAAPAVPAPVAAKPAAAASPAVSPAEARPAPDGKLMNELQAMRNHLQQQIASLSSSVAAGRAQLQSQITNSLTRIQAAAQHSAQSLSGRVMTRLLTAGFSPEVARKVALHAPAHLTAADAETWLQDVITLNLKIAGPEASIVEAGGAYALVGPTGVGKTTTVAKLAAQFAVRFGAGALGLITLDAYRVGAHEQLRTYGRILGAPVHLAQDGATLRELLVSMQNKRLVLIDTCGVSQRDGRLNEVLAILASASMGVPEAMRIQRVLLANAASHAETLDDAARAWRAPECAGCVLTKLDEAARFGGALDTALRYKLRLFGVTNGQRVPEDWHAANARVLAHLALKPGSDAFALAENEALALAADQLAHA